MNGSFRPAVITSRRAQDDLARIKGIHQDLVSGIATQKTRVDAYNQQKQSELAARDSMKTEMDKAKMVADTASQKNMLDFQTNQAELDIKRAALSMKE